MCTPPQKKKQTKTYPTNLFEQAGEWNCSAAILWCSENSYENIIVGVFQIEHYSWKLKTC